MDPHTYSKTVLGVYWDEEADAPKAGHASVELPPGAFLCNGHGLRYNVKSLPVAVMVPRLPAAARALVALGRGGGRLVPHQRYHLTEVERHDIW